jgi:hypothetical protein
MRLQTTTSGLIAALLLRRARRLLNLARPLRHSLPQCVAPAPTAAPSPVSWRRSCGSPGRCPGRASVCVGGADERPRGFIPQLSLAGAVGLLRMSSAEVGPVGYFRLGLHGEYFTASNFLVKRDSPPGGDRDTRVQGALSFGITLSTISSYLARFRPRRIATGVSVGRTRAASRGVCRRPTARIS